MPARLSLVLATIWLAVLPANADSFADRKDQCLACHGDKGVSPTPETPSLGGQPDLFILYQLVGFRDGQRKSDIMNAMLKGLSDDDLRAAGALIAAMPAPPAPAPGDRDRMARGQKLVEQNRCNICHAANLAGQDQVPRLRNQREDYLIKALHDYKSGKRFGGRAEMNDVLLPLDDKALADLAYYLSHLR